jgi:hypothetical protein
VSPEEQRNPPDAAWRQGSIIGRGLIPKATDGLTVSKPIPENSLLILISQDCDIVHRRYEVEPFIEFLVATRIEASGRNKGLQWGKHPRRFQFSFLQQGGEALFEIDINDRYRAPRQILLGGLPEQRLDAKLTEAVCRWVAKRYTRAAFPDEFNRRTDAAKDSLADLFKKQGDLILSIHIRIEPEDTELPEGEDYRILLYAICERHTWEDARSRAAATRLVDQIGIKLAECEGIFVDESVLVPEHRFSLEDLRETDRWDYDYLTYRGGPTEPIGEGFE